MRTAAGGHQEAVEAAMDAEGMPDHHRDYVGRLEELSVALVLLQNAIDEESDRTKRPLETRAATPLGRRGGGLSGRQ